jgi:Ser/Thr protein kinase RdoA (MazF antagonist)
MSETIAVTNSMLSVDALKRIVASSYDLGNILEVRFLQFGLNDTYLVKTQKLEKFILRVYRHGWRSGSDVAYELDALNHLHQQGVSVSVPIPQKDGQLMRELLAPEGTRFMVLFSFAPGQQINYDDLQSSAYGSAVAETHNAMQDFSSPHRRFELDLEHLLETPLRIIRPFLEHRPDDLEYLNLLTEKIRSHLEQLPLDRLERGFCHGDFHGANAFIDADSKITLFDFDCGGIGWRAYDLAVFAWDCRLHDKEPIAWMAFLRGYNELSKVPELDLKAIPLFIGIRQIWLMGLHFGFAHNVGFGWYGDGYLDRNIKFLKDWELEFLSVDSIPTRA